MGQVLTHAVIDVFLSYSEEDDEIAARVHDDLQRSGLNVWGYQDDRVFGVDFRREFKKRLRQAKYFCTLDSENARKSIWIAQEWEIALQRKKSERDFLTIPCLVQSRGPWRKTEFFDGHNYLTYVNLIANYNRGIRQLCDWFGVVFLPAFDLPGDQEIADGIYAAGLEREDARRVIDLYTRFRIKYTSNDSNIDAARSHLTVIVDELKALGGKVPVALHLALGVLEGEVGNHSAAFEHFTEASQRRRKDPRARAALAGAAYCLGRFKKAAQEYEAARRYILSKGAYAEHLGEVIGNLCQVLLARGRPREMAHVLDEMRSHLSHTGEWLALRGKAALLLNCPLEATQYLEEAVQVIENQGKSPPLELLYDLASSFRMSGDRVRERFLLHRCAEEVEDDPELLRSLAEQWLKSGSLSETLRFLRKAVEVAPQAIVVRSELASLLYLNGEVDVALNEAQKVVDQARERRNRLPSREAYYHGMMRYLLDQRDFAAEELQRAQRDDSVVALWPSYETMFGEIPGA